MESNQSFRLGAYKGYVVNNTDPLSVKERVHSEMKILSIMRFNLLIMPIVLIFFQPPSLAGWKAYSKIMQIWMA